MSKDKVQNSKSWCGEAVANKGFRERTLGKIPGVGGMFLGRRCSKT